jgi:hypothetical protein
MLIQCKSNAIKHFCDMHVVDHKGGNLSWSWFDWIVVTW